MTQFPPLFYRIDTAFPNDAPSKARGDALERLLSDFLAQQSYKIAKNIRVSGSELDIIAEHKLTGHKILVECKAQTSNVQSAAVDGIFTDMHVQAVDEGWLVTSGNLGSDAKGKLISLANTGKRLTHISANDLVAQVIASGVLADPYQLISSNGKIGGEVGLILLNSRRLYCIEIKNANSGVLEGYCLLDGVTLKEVSSPEIQKLVSVDIDRYSEGNWISLNKQDDIQQAEKIFQPVVELVAGTDWKDYRPSRPEDFIGRGDTVSELETFIDQVRLGVAENRIVGIKANSGWGKSSLVLKVADRIKSTNAKVSFVAFDCRAAISSEYPSIAVAQTFEKIRTASLEYYSLPTPEEMSAGGIESELVREKLQFLRNSKSVIVIAFDQFEEIIHSDNRALFSKFEQLCHCVDAFKLPIVLIFSWRTDAMVSSDNPAYSLWHRLTDRRHDLKLRAFTHADAVNYIDAAQRSSGVRLEHKDRRFLLDKYVGLPWLIKKLTINLLDRRAEHGPALGEDSASFVEDIFKEDLESLTPEEHSCIETIAKNSPMPFHAIAFSHSDAVVTALIEKRLLVNSGGQLSLYSDIFRDYVLYRRLPSIPNTYCPQASIPKIVQAISILSKTSRTTYDDIAAELNIAQGSADNLARDLQQMGLVRLYRVAGQVTSLVDSSAEATGRLLAFLRDHVILEPFKDRLVNDAGISFDNIVDNAIKAYRYSDLTKETIERYCLTITRLAGSFGLVDRTAGLFWNGRPVKDIVREGARPVRSAARGRGFMGQAPPSRVWAFLEKVFSGENDEKQLRADGLRNAMFAANALGITRTEGRIVHVMRPVASYGDMIRLAHEQEFVCFVRDILSDQPETTAEDIGRHLAMEYDLDLHPSSLRRYGHALRIWALAT